MQQSQFDVFLCHNSKEKTEVAAIRQQLKQLGILAWLDKYDFEPFRPWQKQLEAIIPQVKAVAVFIGSSGVGPWADIEMREFLNEFANNPKLRIGLVILPNCSDELINTVPKFMKGFYWVDFREQDPNPMGQLIWGITGLKPESPFIIQPQPPQNALELLNSHLGVQPNTSAIEAVERLKPYLDTQPQPTQTDDLASEKGIDYTRLRDLLAAQEWEQADEETYRVMIKVLGKNKGHIFTVEEIRSFPCTDLHTIDNLWVKHSAGRFGFSIQKKIYLSVGGPLDGDFYQDIWRKFGDKIGWRVNEIWICGCDEDEEINFDISSPEGHLPVVSGQLEGKVIVIFPRIETYGV